MNQEKIVNEPTIIPRDAVKARSLLTFGSSVLLFWGILEIVGALISAAIMLFYLHNFLALLVIPFGLLFGALFIWLSQKTRKGQYLGLSIGVLSYKLISFGISTVVLAVMSRDWFPLIFTSVFVIFFVFALLVFIWAKIALKRLYVVVPVAPTGNSVQDET